MIDVTGISCGWATLHIGRHQFEVSYLSDLKHEIDSLLDFDIEKEEYVANRITLEGEGDGDLALISYLTFDDLGDSKYGYVLNIVWQRLFGKDKTKIILKFPYNDFCEEWKRVSEDMKDRYIINFICPQTKKEIEEEYERY